MPRTAARHILARYRTSVFSLFGLQEDLSQLFPDVRSTWFTGRCKWMCREKKKSGSETRERLACNNVQGRHRDGDILSMPSGEANQDPCWDFFFPSPLHFFIQTAPCCVFRPHSMRDRHSSLIGSIVPSQTWKVMTSNNYLAPGPDLSLTSRCQPPLRHWSPIFARFLNPDCHTGSKYVQAAQLTIMLHFLSLRQRPLIPL